MEKYYYQVSSNAEVIYLTMTEKEYRDYSSLYNDIYETLEEAEDAANEYYKGDEEI